MPTLIAQLEPFDGPDGRAYSAQVCGLPRPDGMWEGWLAFFDAGGRAWHTGRETVQPHRGALAYWASGLTPTYLDGALGRAVAAEPEVAVSGHADMPVEEDESDVVRLAIPVTAVADDAGHVLAVAGPVSGRVVAIDPAVGRLTLRAGAQVMTVATEPAVLEAVQVGQLVTVRLGGL